MVIDPPADDVSDVIGQPIVADRFERRPLAKRRPASTSTIVVVASTAAISLGVCFLVWAFSATSRPDAQDRVTLCIALFAPAIALAFARSTYLLDYLLILVTINRELRRLMDWGQGRYDKTPLSSVLPILVAGLMIPIIVNRWRRLPTDLRSAGSFIIAGFLYALALGIARKGFPALYAASEYGIPFIVLFYCVSCRPEAALVRRWATVLGTLGVLAGAYGIYQWIDPPIWDAAWVIWSTMYSSMGAPRPFQLSICSTLESRGPASMYFAVTTVMLMTLPYLRSRGGFVVAAIPGVALLLTQARTGLIYVVLTLIAVSLFSRRGTSIVKVVIALCITGVAVSFILGRERQSTVIYDRVATLGDLKHDGSANGRVGIAAMGVMTVLKNPIGFGFGSGGNAILIAGKNAEAESVGDNGYLEILSTLGVPGTALFAIGLYKIVRLFFRNRRLPTGQEPTTHLAMGLLVALAPVLMVGNALASLHGSYVWILGSRHLAARPSKVAWPHRDER